MANIFRNSPIYKHFGYVVALTFGLGSCGEQPQALPVSTAPLPQTEAARYYLNSRPSTKEVLEQLDPKTMTSMDVLSGQKAADYAHDASIKKVLVVQTK